jgi:hypothetical protein
MHPCPPPLALSQTDTGALVTAPLSTVVNAATDALYADLYSLVHGEIGIVTSVSSSSSTSGGESTPGGGDGAGANNKQQQQDNKSKSLALSVEEKLGAAALSQKTAAAVDPASSNNNNDTTTTNANKKQQQQPVLEVRKQRMANLSFAQRRHELTRRIVRHSRSIAHVHALVASSVPPPLPKRNNTSTLDKKGDTLTQQQQQQQQPRLCHAVKIASDALQHVKTTMTKYDIIQDILYYHHDTLFTNRQFCHDIYGALCVLCTPPPTIPPPPSMPLEQQSSTTTATNGSSLSGGGGGGIWPDFPKDVALLDIDRYRSYMESTTNNNNKKELQNRLVCAVRRKLILGEVGIYGTTTTTKHKMNQFTTTVVGGDDNGGAITRTKVDGRRSETQPLPWRVVLTNNGGSVHLTYGSPRTTTTSTTKAAVVGEKQQKQKQRQQYPIEAHISVLSESQAASWKLLSITISCIPKTGESDHQLIMNHKQMFNLHRICDRAMIVEEAICVREQQRRKEEDNNNDDNKQDVSSMNIDNNDDDDDDRGLQPDAIVPRPLYRLFEVAHTFALSLQLELLSSQAEALRRGAWGSGGPTIVGGSEVGRECISVSPVYFYDEKKTSIVSNDSSVTNSNIGRTTNTPIAVMAIHFWSCDDSYGSPRVDDLSSPANVDFNDNNKRKDDASIISRLSTPSNKLQRKDDNYLPIDDCRGEKRLSLCIRAIPTVGLVVSLSGGSDMEESDISSSATTIVLTPCHHTQRNIDKLLSSIQNPFELSMSDALLAATVLCADRRCRAMVSALMNGGQGKSTTNSKTLPSWLSLEVECGTISIAAIISYGKSSISSTVKDKFYTVLFRLACDSRTGRFVPVFPRPSSLLRLLSCNDPAANDNQVLRSSVLSNRGGTSTKRTDMMSRESTGRIVRDSFDAMTRSMDTLGRKCGVGGEWNDVDLQSASLRKKSVDQTCSDVIASLTTCCGMATVFGVAAIALKVACGIDPLTDM